MDSFENLLTRRSIRKFETKNIPKKLVKKILKAAMYAPSACNSRPWEFIVVNDKNLMKKISTFTHSVAMAADAPLGIMVCGNLEKNYKNFWPQDCAAVTENILLAAHALGLGTVWTGIYPKNDLIKLYNEHFQLPKNIIPFCFIPIGYPNEIKKDPERYEEKKIHWNKW